MSIELPNRLFTKVGKGLPLRTVLVVSFILQILGAVGLVGICHLETDKRQLTIWRIS